MAHGSGKRLLLSAWSRDWAKPFAAMISRPPSAIWEGSAWPPNRLLPMIQSEMHLEGCFCSAAYGLRPLQQTAMTPRSKCLKSSNALSGCSHHDDDSAVALSVVS